MGWLQRNLIILPYKKICPAIRLPYVCYPFGIPSFCKPFVIRSRFSNLLTSVIGPNLLKDKHSVRAEVLIAKRGQIPLVSRVFRNRYMY